MQKRFHKIPMVFISYAREDQAQAYAIYEKLEENSCEPWIDVKKLLPGQQWRSTIKQIISESDFFLACFSKNSVSKIGFFQTELKEAYEVLKQFPTAKIFFIPVRLDECDVPPEFSEYSWVDIFEREGMTKLIETILKEWETRTSLEGNQIAYPLRDLLTAIELPSFVPPSERFIGTFHHNIDGYRRLTIPAVFRDALSQSEIYVFKSPFSKCLLVLSSQRYFAFLEKLRALPIDDQQVVALTRQIMGQSSIVEMDKPGKILISSDQIHSAEINSTVTVVGMGDRIELWSYENWLKNMQIDATDEIKTK